MLQRIGPRAIPILVLALEHWREDVRFHAAYSLAELGPAARPAVPLGIAAWRRAAHPQGAPQPGDLRNEYHPWGGGYPFHGLAARNLADITLGNLPELTMALRDRQAIVRMRACESLEKSRTGSLAPVAELDHLLSDPERRVRLAAARALVAGFAGFDENLHRSARELLEREGE